MRTSLDIARLSRENSSATFETGPLQNCDGSSNRSRRWGARTRWAISEPTPPPPPPPPPPPWRLRSTEVAAGARADARRAFAAGEAEVHVAHQEHRCAHR